MNSVIDSQYFQGVRIDSRTQNVSIGNNFNRKKNTSQQSGETNHQTNRMIILKQTKDAQQISEHGGGKRLILSEFQDKASSQQFSAMVESIKIQKDVGWCQKVKYKQKYSQAILIKFKSQSVLLGQFVNQKKNGRGILKSKLVQNQGEYLDDQLHGNVVQKSCKGQLKLCQYEKGSKIGFTKQKVLISNQLCELELEINKDQKYRGKLKSGDIIFLGLFQVNKPPDFIKMRDAIYEFNVKVKNQQLGMIITNKSIYRGSILDFKAQGFGTCRFNDGYTYKGEVSNGKFNGHGSLSIYNIQICGTWLNGLIDGEMNSDFGTGVYYQMFKLGNKHGNGILVYKFQEYEVICEFEYANSILIKGELFVNSVLYGNFIQKNEKLIFQKIGGTTLEMQSFAEFTNNLINIQSQVISGHTSKVLSSTIDTNFNPIYMQIDSLKADFEKDSIIKGYDGIDPKIELYHSKYVKVLQGNQENHGRVTDQGFRMIDGTYMDVMDQENFKMNPLNYFATTQDLICKIRADGAIEKFNLPGCLLKPRYQFIEYKNESDNNCNAIILSKNRIKGYFNSQTLDLYVCLMVEQNKIELGQYVNNRFEFGTIIFKNEYIYSGELYNGQPHGEGTKIMLNGEFSSEGWWFKDKIQGYSIVNTKNGRYKGSIVSLIYKIGDETLHHATDHRAKWIDYFHSKQPDTRDQIPSNLIEIYWYPSKNQSNFMRLIENQEIILKTIGSFLYYSKSILSYVGDYYLNNCFSNCTYIINDNTVTITAAEYVKFSRKAKITTLEQRSQKLKSGELIQYWVGQYTNDQLFNILETDDDGYKQISQTSLCENHQAKTYINKDGCITCTWETNKQKEEIQITQEGMCKELLEINGIQQGIYINIYLYYKIRQSHNKIQQ